MKSPSSTDPKQVREIFTRWSKLNPNPQCELIFYSPYQLLVSVILSAQATDKIVNRSMSQLYKAGFSPDSMLKMGQSGLLEKIRSIGLAPTKSRNIYLMTQILINKFKGQVPSTRQDLESLPGVGRKTANVVLGELFGLPTLGVDTHVFRVTNRLDWHQESTPLKAEKKLLSIISKSYLPKAHHWLILHGRYTCLAKKPRCYSCNISDLCPYPHKESL